MTREETLSIMRSLVEAGWIPEGGDAPLFIETLAKRASACAYEVARLSEVVAHMRREKESEARCRADFISSAGGRTPEEVLASEIDLRGQLEDIASMVEEVQDQETLALCAHCHLPVSPKDTAHWRSCPKHHARAEVERLEAEIRRMRDGL